MTASIDDYALAYVFGVADTLGIADAFVRRDELLTAIAEQVRRYVASFDGEHFLDVQRLAAKLFELLEAANVFDYIDDEWAGQYVRFRSGRYPKFREQYLGGNQIHAVSTKIGKRFYPDAFQNYVQKEIVGDDLNDVIAIEDVRAPASDRIVTFSDNQISELSDQADLVIAEISAQNQIDNSPGLRELLLGQLRAGRELIRAGSFKLYLMELTLLDTLRFLARRYEHEAIGGLAAALITALMKHMGIDV